MSRVALTVRIPEELLDEAKCLKNEQESLNDFITNAVEFEVGRRRGLHAFEEIMRQRQEDREQFGLQPDSTALIRALREGRERYG